VSFFSLFLCGVCFFLGFVILTRVIIRSTLVYLPRLLLVRYFSARSKNCIFLILLFLGILCLLGREKILNRSLNGLLFGRLSSLNFAGCGVRGNPVTGGC